MSNLVHILYKMTHTHKTSILPDDRISLLVKTSCLKCFTSSNLIGCFCKLNTFNSIVIFSKSNFIFSSPPLMSAYDATRNSQSTFTTISFSGYITISVSSPTNSTRNLNSPTLISKSSTIPLGSLVEQLAN